MGQVAIVGRCVRDMLVCPQVWTTEVRCSMHIANPSSTEGLYVLFIVGEGVGLVLKAWTWASICVSYDVRCEGNLERGTWCEP